MRGFGDSGSDGERSGEPTVNGSDGDRGGNWQKISISDVVLGDIVDLRRGYEVPDDSLFIPGGFLKLDDGSTATIIEGKIIGVSFSILITVVVFLRFKLGKELEHHDSGAQAIRGNQADFADFEAN
ncbi:hypothetical protein LWI28_028755 [Acer negundo]|uniref:Uncharacterized protein n=1 Tax=Acer negundo TaxID=4023 RepID=A0AAD5IHT2_ACENE|nr:hypothetical protein LWI28_028755 [Acer negundo]